MGANGRRHGGRPRAAIKLRDRVAIAIRAIEWAERNMGTDYICGTVRPLVRWTEIRGNLYRVCLADRPEGRICINGRLIEDSNTVVSADVFCGNVANPIPYPHEQRLVRFAQRALRGAPKKLTDGLDAPFTFA